MQGRLGRGPVYAAVTLVFLFSGSSFAQASPAGEANPAGGGPPVPQDGATFFPNVRVTDGTSPFPQQVEPTMAIAPNGTVYVGWKEAMTATGAGYRVGFARSVDGGWTWSPNALIDLLPGYTRQSDPWLELDDQGRLYYAHLQWNSTADQLPVYRSDDGGTTWPVKSLADDRPAFADKESMVVDYTGRVHVAYDDAGFGNDIRVTHSNDSAASWAPTQRMADAMGSIIGPYLAADDGDRVYAAWVSTQADNILFDRSFNGGLSWGVDRRVNTIPGTVISNPQLALPSVAVAPNGAVYVAYADNRGGDQDIWVSRSDDYGSIWQPAVRVNDDTSGREQWMVDVRVDARGFVHAAWEDNRTGNLSIMYSWSEDGGQTWAPNVAVTSAETSSTYTRPGDYLSLRIGPNERIYVLWTDGRSGVDQDIYIGWRNQTSDVTVVTDPPNLDVLVDGVLTPTPATFSWFIGSQHSLEAISPLVGGTGERYTWSSWSDGGSRSHAYATGPFDATLIASFLHEYSVTAESDPPGFGVEVDSVWYGTPISFWWVNGSAHMIEAPDPVTIPETSIVFLYWSNLAPQVQNYTVWGTETLIAYYSVSHMVFVDTNPRGLQVWVDGVPYNDTASFWWPAGSTHNLTVIDVQGAWPLDYYDFTGWNDGEPSTSRMIVVNTPGNFVANFDHYACVRVVTDPAGRTVWIDGTPRIAPVAFEWPYGSLHDLNVTSPQTIATDTRAVFLGWDDGGSQNRTVTVTGPRNLTAQFLVESFVTLDTDPSGLALQVDGAWYLGPVSFWWANGSSHDIAVNATQATQHFVAWSDGLPASHAVLVEDPMTVIAQYAPNQPPTASFIVSPAATGTVDTFFTFNALGSSDPEGPIVLYVWNFGDDETAEGPVVTHAYTAKGPHLVTLTVTDGDGATDSETKTVTVVNRPPTVTPTAPPDAAVRIVSGQALTFTAVAADADGDPLTFAWIVDDTIGGGDSLTLEWTAAAPGTYKIKVTASDGTDAASFEWTVTVVAADSDGDGLDDAWEVDHFGDLSTNPGDDPDNDGMSNLQEQQEGRNPAVADALQTGPGTLGWILLVLIAAFVALLFVFAWWRRRKKEEPDEEAPPRDKA